MLHLRVEKALCCRSDSVNLRECSYSHETYTGCENRKTLGEPLPLSAHAVLYIVKGSPQIASVTLVNSEFNSQQTLCIFRCHSEAGCDYHPENRTRSSRNHCCCNSYNVSRTDGCRQGCAKSRKARYLSAAACFVVHHILQCLPKLPELQNPEPAGEIQSRSKNEDN